MSKKPTPVWRENMMDATTAISELDRQLLKGGRKKDIAKENSQQIVTVSYINRHIKFRKDQPQAYVFEEKGDRVKLINRK